MSSGWKQRERLVASWFMTTRNPLSGRNNRNDDGTKRIGDVIMRHGMVEVKRRGSVSMAGAQETRKLARAHGVPWAHVEFRTGTPEMVKITLDFKDAEFVCRQLQERWKSRARLPEDGVSS